MTKQATDLIAGVALLLVLWAWWFMGIQPLLTDWLRQQLFDIRGDLFEFAATGHIGFDSPQYLELRRRLNALIRKAQTISLPRCIGISLAFRAYGTTFVDEWPEGLATLSPQVAEYLQTLHKRAALAVATRLFLIPGLIVSPLVVLVLAFARAKAKDKLTQEVFIVERGVVDLDCAERVVA